MVAYIGTSGWSYEHRNGVLYDQTSRPRDRLEQLGGDCRSFAEQDQRLGVA